MLKLPGKLTAETFLAQHWQKKPLFMQQALERIRPSVTRNEIGWLATLDDVESRLVFTDHESGRPRYRAETGPFDPDYLASLPKRDWTLLVHDVEKHLPVMRKLFGFVPFIPDWRFDDLMVSFAAPGGGVGPHRDNYDVFLCQGIGTREWHVTTEDIPDDSGASDDLALTVPFAGQVHRLRQGDVLYLPPGAAHWGTASRACITYSIGMRAPQLSDLLTGLPDDGQQNPFYCDPDLGIEESAPGFISEESVDRALQLTGDSGTERERIAKALGRYVTQTKEWITPDGASADEARSIVNLLTPGTKLSVHGMARIAWDRRHMYVNGACRERPDDDPTGLASLCADRAITVGRERPLTSAQSLIWMLEKGLFELPEKL